MAYDNDHAATIQRIVQEDAIGQLRRREGLMATLGSEQGVMKLDWVEGVARLLKDTTLLEQVEEEARELWQRGIRHLIWAGMGGSVLTVRVLSELGFCDGRNGEAITIYPLDSTDPAALNTIIQRIAADKNVSLQLADGSRDAVFLHKVFDDVMMVGVAMGMTSEEPITHLTWFVEVLEQAQLPVAEHILVMSLPDSYLDQFARQRQAPVLPLQLDGGTGTGGRMSAPTTRVFLLPAALYLTRLLPGSGHLRTMLAQAWEDYDLDLAVRDPKDHPFVQLAAALYDASEQGICRLLLSAPELWRSLVPWIEQLMEESLGKGEKGVVVFHDQSLHESAPYYQARKLLHVHVTSEPPTEYDKRIFVLEQPYLVHDQPTKKLASVATSFLGWQLTMALYGYLHSIPFAGQPAVETYKSKARALRTESDPLQVLSMWQYTVREQGLTLFSPLPVPAGSRCAQVYAQALRLSESSGEKPLYLDLTVNGQIAAELQLVLAKEMLDLAGRLLGVPVKLRQAPADYHSTEQSEMDGPPQMISLRLLLQEHEPVLIGNYDDLFLRAQAVSTWQAMIEQKRLCFLLLLDSPGDDPHILEHFFSQVIAALGATERF